MKKLLLLSITLLIFSVVTKAQQIMGSNITYKPIDSVKYEVTVKVYQDCINGNNVADSIKVEWNSGANFFYDRIYKAAENDVSGYGPTCVPQSSCGDTGFYGVREVIFKDTIDLTGINACNFKIIWMGVRVPTISMTTEDYYNYSTLNKCLAKPNTSVTFANAPRILVEDSQDFIFNPGAADNSNPLDSVSYKITCPLKDASNVATLFSSQACKSSCTSCSACIVYTGSTATCHFDSLTGAIAFRPLKPNELSYYVIEVTEWRKINGSMAPIAAIRYESAVLVIPAKGNKVPTVTATSSVACSGQTACIDITTNDADSNDSTFLDIPLAPPGAVITYSHNGRFATATVCWTPGEEHISNNPYLLCANVRDNFCSITGKATVTRSIFVRHTPDSSDFAFGKKTVQCNQATVQLNFKNNNASSFIYQVEPIDSILAWKAYGNDSVAISFADTGWNKFSVRLRSNIPCTSLPIIDSVYIPTLPFVPPLFTINNNTAICLGDSVFFHINLFSTAIPFEFSWSGGTYNTAQNFYYTPQKTAEYSAVVIDSNHCAAAKTVKITVNGLPVIEAGVNDTVCPYTPFQLTAQPVSGSATPFKYNWVGVDSLQTVSTAVNKSTLFKVFATDKNGCKSNTDSVTVDVYLITMALSPNTSICLGDSVALTATVSSAQGTVSYNWQNIGANTPLVKVKPLKTTTYHISIADSFGCTLKDSVKVTVDTIALKVSRDTFICLGSPITLTATATNALGKVNYNWLNTSFKTAAIVVSPVVTTTYTVEIKDSLGCTLTDSVKVSVTKLMVTSIADTTVCAESAVTVKAIAQNGTQPFVYAWNTGDSTGRFVTSPKVAKTVSVIATDANGCKAYDTTVINVFPHDGAQITPIPFLCLDAGPHQLQATPTGGFWFGQGVVNNNFFNPVITGVGKHSIKYFYTNKYSCTDSTGVTVTVAPIPMPNFLIDKDSGAVPLTIKLVYTTPGITTSWQWKVENADSNFVYTSTDENPEFTLTNAATYTITLIVTDSNGCTGQIIKTNAVKAYSTVAVAAVHRNVYSIYPNPAKSTVTLETDFIIKQVKITDIIGRVFTVPVLYEGTKATINLESLETGNYIINAESIEGETIISPIIITK